MHKLSFLNLITWQEKFNITNFLRINETHNTIYLFKFLIERDLKQKCIVVRVNLLRTERNSKRSNFYNLEYNFVELINS